MNSESGSALQKASFALLLFIAAALAYLIVRDRVRDQRERAEAAPANEANEPVLASPAPPPPVKSSFAPLRPRAETNPPRVAVGGAKVAAVDQTVTATRPPISDTAGEGRTTTGVLAPVQSEVEAVGVTSGRGESFLNASVSGRVLLRGTPPAEKTITLDALCGRLHPEPMTTRHFIVGEQGGLANVFLYVKSPLAAKNLFQSSVPVLDNVNCQFQPYILGVRAGQPFEIRNSDPILHNVHLVPKRQGGVTLNVGLLKDSRTARTIRRLEDPEVFVQVKCDVHPWMFAYIGVVDHPWFSVTDTNGVFTMPPGLPAGRHTIAAVHPKAGEVTQKITTGSDPLAPLTFTLDVPKTLAQSGTP